MEYVKQFSITDIDNKYQPCLKPVIYYAGGKSYLLPKLREIYKPFQNRRLVDLFTGGMNVPLGLMPEKALINDINPHVINLYKQIRNKLQIKIPLINTKEIYLQYKNIFNNMSLEEQIKSPRAAEIFYYLNRTGFGGLTRFNSNGKFNVPYGNHKQVNYVKNMELYYKVFQKWDFTCKDFSQIIIDAKDFIYCDPPYYKQYSEYNKEFFTWNDHVRLIKYLKDFNNPILISNSNTEEIISLYEENGFIIEYIMMPRRLSKNKQHRKQVKEILAKRGM